MLGTGRGRLDDYVRRLNRARLTLLLTLVSISVLFVTFTVFVLPTAAWS
jgi:hypothetical protein